MVLVPAGAAHAAGPQPGSLEYLQRDNQNMADAHGRNTQQQLGNPAYMTALQTEHSSFNPLWRHFDRSRDRRTATPGRTRRIAIVGHSLGASAVSYVQGVDRRVETVVALD